jgi:hypothetical protein
MIDTLTSGGFDIVCGWRKDRKDAFVSRSVPSIIANRLISWATGVRLHDYGCSLKIFRAEVVKPLKLYGEMHRFLPAIASEQGVAIAELVVNHRARRHGSSNYGISRTVRLIWIDHGQVPSQLFDQAAADFWPAGHRHGRARRRDHRLFRSDSAVRALD